MSKRILIARLDRIGDVMLSTPVIKAVRDACPDSYIAVMVRPYAREIVDGNPYLNEVIVYDKDHLQKGLAGNYKFISDIRKKKFDIALALHPTNRTHIVLGLAGIPVRVGYDRKAGFLLTKRIPHTKQFGMKHEIDYALDMLRYIGIDAANRKMYMPVNSVSDRRIEEIFRNNDVKDTDMLVAINPGASCVSKRWRVKRFADVANGLIKKYGAKIVIISGRDDKSFGDALASLITGSCINLSGKTSVGDIAGVLKRAGLFISNDSGPVHIGCAVGTPVIAIFGRSDRGLSPRRWGPSGERDIVLHKDVGCGTCYAHNCKLGFRCLDSITVEEVLMAADKIVKKQGKGHDWRNE